MKQHYTLTKLCQTLQRFNIASFYFGPINLFKKNICILAPLASTWLAPPYEQKSQGLILDLCTTTNAILNLLINDWLF